MSMLEYSLEDLFDRFEEICEDNDTNIESETAEALLAICKHLVKLNRRYEGHLHECHPHY